MTQTTLSPMYRAMIYFVVATLHFYRNDIKPELSVDRFRKVNSKVVKQVFHEATNDLNYELSHEQMSRGISAYMTQPVPLKEVANAR